MHRFKGMALKKKERINFKENLETERNFKEN